MSTETRYTLTGLKCGGCVAKATAALQALPGVTAAQVDLATHSARVEGEVAPAA
ncbi:MAG: cation transporter, partial [Gammaproteobacteria bacterium]|nr:cation transporter [Gammaproteobacteria bacterium]